MERDEDKDDEQRRRFTERTVQVLIKRREKKKTPASLMDVLRLGHVIATHASGRSPSLSVRVEEVRHVTVSSSSSRTRSWRPTLCVYAAEKRRV